MVGFHKAELAIALTLASCSFGAFSRAAKEQELAKSLGSEHPSYADVVNRAEFPDALGKTFAMGATLAGAMAISGLAKARRNQSYLPLSARFCFITEGATAPTN